MSPPPYPRRPRIPHSWGASVTTRVTEKGNEKEKEKRREPAIVQLGDLALASTLVSILALAPHCLSSHQLRLLSLGYHPAPLFLHVQTLTRVLHLPVYLPHRFRHFHGHRRLQNLTLQIRQSRNGGRVRHLYHLV